MKGRPVDQMVYEKIFPKPRPSDPRNFTVFLHQCLILEVRCQVHAFYGHLDTHEAKYPGLDYCNPYHRNRLSRWPWHRRLFRAFEFLALTKAEIGDLTKWEGTRWAKERYEYEQRVKIRDTAGDHMEVWLSASSECRPPLNVSAGLVPHTIRTHPAGNAPHVDRAPSFSQRRPPLAPTLNTESSPDLANLPSVSSLSPGFLPSSPLATESASATASDPALRGPVDPVNSAGDDTDEEMETIGFSPNDRLRAQAAHREAVDTTAAMDDQWEQWFKRAMESGSLTSLLDAARDASMPDQLRDVLRCLIEPDRPAHQIAHAHLHFHQPGQNVHGLHWHSRDPARQQLRSRDPARQQLRFELNARRAATAASQLNAHAMAYRVPDVRPAMTGIASHGPEVHRP